MSDIPRLAAELAERMEALGYSKGIIGGLPHWTSKSLSRSCQSTARALFAWLYENGREDLRSVTSDDIRKFYLQKAARVVNVHHLRYTLRQACDILTASGRLRCRCDKIFGLAIASETRLMPCLSSDEIARILNAPDRSKPAGKRDFAMLILGATTGLRACDVASIMLDDIDWRKGELRIVQRKTSVGLSHPLTEGVGNAVRDYILNGRPESGCREIFLSPDGGSPGFT